MRSLRKSSHSLLAASGSAWRGAMRSYNGATMMVQTQISIEAELRSRIRTRARALGISMAEYFRQLVERDLSDTTRNMDLSVVFNLGASGGADVATNKDRMAAEAVGAEKARRTAP